MSYIVSLLLLLSAARQSYGALFTNATQLPSNVFDYIVIGSGAAGAVVANRLSENSHISVLVLEAGSSNDGILASQLAPNTPYDWNYTTTTQAGYNGRKIAYPRGKILGGSTSINYMVYSRGSKEDWDKYAAISGDVGWSWAKMLTYIRKNENFVIAPGNVSITGKYIPSEHSTNGVVSVSLPGYPTPLDDFVLKTTREQSSEWPYNPDISSGDVLGLGWTQATIGNGTRSSSATTYLGSRYINKPNLNVLINAHATKLVQTGTSNGFPSFHKVEFGEKSGATRRIATATREIIISAGSIGTPQLLQLSGIGKASDLTPFNIKPLVSLPDVGYRLSDHVLLTNHYYTNASTYDSMFREPAIFDLKLTEWTANKTGPLANTVTSQLGWLRLPKNSSIFQTEADPSSGPNSSHWEIIFSNIYASPGATVPAPTEGNFLTVFTNLISPSSRGEIKIQSADPFTAPNINPNFLTTPFDIFTMIDAVKSIRRLMASKTWAGYIVKSYEDITLPEANTDQAIEKFVRDNSNSVWHPVGTASMSPVNANWGVVNPDLTVKKTSGLRVVDASILPFVPNAHTQIPVYLIAERAADLIKAAQK